MIVDRWENLERYLPPGIQEKLSPFLSRLSSDMEEGFYPIDGEHIFARVMSYKTLRREECKVEAHNRYIDIQATLHGAEGIDIFSREKLCESEAYDAEKDAAYFLPHPEVCYGTGYNLPGVFTMIFPEEAHRPMERINGENLVKKIVIKVEAQAYGK